MSVFIHTECITCYACVDACRYGAIYEDYPIFYIDDLECVNCGECIDTCPTNAIRGYEPNNLALIYKGARTSTYTPSSTYGLEIRDASGTIICDGSSNMLRILDSNTISGGVNRTTTYSQTFSITSVDKEPVVIPYNPSYLITDYSSTAYSSTGGSNYDRVTVTIYGWSYYVYTASLQFHIVGWR